MVCIRGAERVSRKVRRGPRDGEGAQMAHRIENRVGANVVTPIRWAAENGFLSASAAVFDL